MPAPVRAGSSRPVVLFPHRIVVTLCTARGVDGARRHVTAQEREGHDQRSGACLEGQCSGLTVTHVAGAVIEKQSLDEVYDRLEVEVDDAAVLQAQHVQVT